MRPHTAEFRGRRLSKFDPTPEQMPGQPRLLKEVRSLLADRAIQRRYIEQRQQWLIEHPEVRVNTAEEFCAKLSTWAKDYLDIDVSAEFGYDALPEYRPHKTVPGEDGDMKSAQLFVADYAQQGTQHQLIHELCHALVAHQDEIGKYNYNLDDLQEIDNAEWMHRESEVRLMHTLLLIQAGHEVSDFMLQALRDRLQSYAESEFELDFPGKQELLDVMRGTNDELLYRYNY